VAEDADPQDMPFTIPPADLARQLDLLAARGVRTITVSAYAELLRAGAPVPPDTVLVTLDDAYADTVDVWLPALLERGMTGTVYVTTGCVGRRVRGSTMIDWRGVEDLHRAGIEIGAHSHTHAQLDVLSPGRVRDEMVRPRDLLEHRLSARVASFAYPHGFHTQALKKAVAATGYSSAAGVKNAFSGPGDDLFALARLTLTRETTDERLAGWLDGDGAPDTWTTERLRTRAWRLSRRLRARGRGHHTGHRPQEPAGRPAPADLGDVA
jgi:peptidoglycan/xylan/chitin deacetylase (PgdA/CDA1 family)